MRTTTPTAQTGQVRHLSESLISQLAKGKEWATPGVEAALQRVVAGFDSGIESASPSIQAGLRRLAEDLAGGAQPLTPSARKGPKRGAAKGVPAAMPSVSARTRRTAPGKAWLIAGAVAVAVTAGLAGWLAFRPPVEEPAALRGGTAFQRGDTDRGADTAEAQP